MSNVPLSKLPQPIFVDMDSMLRSETSPLRVSAPRIVERAGGLLPTMTTRNNQHSPSMRKWPAYARLQDLAGGKKTTAEFWEWMFGLPERWTVSN